MPAISAFLGSGPRRGGGGQARRAALLPLIVLALCGWGYGDGSDRGHSSREGHSSRDEHSSSHDDRSDGRAHSSDDDRSDGHEHSSEHGHRHRHHPPRVGSCHGVAATIVGTEHRDVLWGTPGDDVIVGLGGSDLIIGRGGDDLICAGDGNDVVFGGPGRDVIDGGAGFDRLHGGVEDDSLDGGLGHDLLFGGRGRDRCVNGRPIHCELGEVNTPPVADAGPDRTVAQAETVILDGSGSSDAEGNPLTFSWSFVSSPPGSNPLLSDPTAVMPSFVVPLPGEYVVQLVVNDGQLDSEPDTVVLTTANSRPIADAGPDRAAAVGTLVTLDGSGSSDPDGDPLSFLWSFVERPVGSAAALSDATTVTPGFTVDVPGLYVVELVVSDGALDSEADAVSVTTVNSPPVADAGPDRVGRVGHAVSLDGSASSDVDGDPLGFLWSLLSAPPGSAAALSDPAAVMPTLTPDLPGDYLVQLVVNDGQLDSDPDTALVSTLNSAPVADAGPDQTTRVLETVVLDGSGSSDVDGDPLTFAWALSSVPAGSAAALSDPTAIMPSFVPDLPGSYVAQLVVHDGSVPSAPDAVVVTTENSPPVADAGPDQTGFVLETVVLDGSGSTDVDGDLLSFQWALVSAPPGSAAALSDPTAVMPSLTLDQPGTYVAQLVVSDGLASSAPDPVTITTLNSAPVADAGPDQTLFVGDPVLLDGGGSSDVDGDPLSFQWSFTSLPAGSGAVLVGALSPTPSFTIDLPGTYVVQLVVGDGSLESPPDTVSVTTQNSPPVADAGADQAGFVGDVLTLDGSGSSDADGDPLTYGWSFTARPAGSTASLSGADTPSPSFTVDRSGIFVAQLIVSDGVLDSAPDTVTLTIGNRPPVADAGPDQDVQAGDLVTLDGSGSSDPDGDPLSWSWTLTAAPVGSAAALVDADTATPAFDADLPGTYTAELVVNDGSLDSAPDEVVVTASPRSIGLVPLGEPLIGVGRSLQVQVVLPRPAPAGGASVDLASDVPGALDVSPLSVFVPEGGSLGVVTLTGLVPAATVLRAAAPGYGDGSLDVVVTDKLVQLPDAFAVPLGQEAVLTVAIGPNPAPAGGVTITLTSEDENVVAVSAFVTILPGAFTADAIVSGVRPGAVRVTATNPDYATDSTLVSTTAALNVAQATTRFPAGFPGNLDVQLLAGGALVPAPSPGLVVTFASSDPGCAVAAPLTIPTGLSIAAADPAYGGSQPLPCSAVLTAEAAGTTPDTVTVTVDPPPAISVNGLGGTVGAGLQTGNGVAEADLGASAHGGVTVRIESSDPAIALVSPDGVTPGTPFIDVPLADGQVRALFRLQGVAPGSAVITASATRFADGTGTANVVQSAVRISGLVTALDSLDPADAFTVQVGTPNAAGTNLLALQAVRAGAPPLVLTIDSTDPAVGAIVGPTSTGGSVAVEIPTGQFQASAAFQPLSAGPTTVSVSSPGLLTTGAGSVGVTVTQPVITVNGLAGVVGAGLQTGNGVAEADLSASAHGGVTVRIESSNPAIALVSPDGVTPGTPFIDVPLANGQVRALFRLQGVAPGSAVITASAPRFADGIGTANVVQSAVRIAGLVTALDSLDPADAFNVQVGTPNAAGTNLLALQAVRAGAPPLVLTVDSSDPAVGEIVGPTSTGGSVAFEIPPGQYQASAAFQPLSAGPTTVSVSSPGLLTTGAGSVGVTVTQPIISVNGLAGAVGAGLQTGNGVAEADLSASAHGGVTVRIESSNPAIALVSPDGVTPGTPFIDVPLANGQVRALFRLQGVEGADGDVVITASAPGFVDGNGAATVVPPAVRITGLATSLTAGGPADPFTVQIGTPNASGSNLSTLQAVRAGGPPVVMTVTSSDLAVAALTTAGGTSGTAVVQFDPGVYQVGTVSLTPLVPGLTQVSAAATGVITTGAGNVAVTVNP